jgi:hypothetical protein
MCKTLAQLFGEARDLDRDDGLSLRYQVMPWKRIIATIVYRPSVLAECLRRMADRLEVVVDVIRDEALIKGRYRIEMAHGDIVLRGLDASTSLKTVERIEKARVRAGRSRFAVEVNALHFLVTSYEPRDLAQRFEATCRWHELGLPSLLERPWLRLQVRPKL